MSHNVEQMFSVKETPWHRLGRIIHIKEVKMIDAVDIEPVILKKED